MVGTNKEQLQRAYLKTRRWLLKMVVVRSAAGTGVRTVASTHTVGNDLLLLFEEECPVVTVAAEGSDRLLQEVLVRGAKTSVLA